MSKNYKSLSAYKKDGETIRIFSIKANVSIANLVEKIVSEYADNHPDFKELYKAVEKLGNVEV
jgi:hypothetical protein